MRRPPANPLMGSSLLAPATVSSSRGMFHASCERCGHTESHTLLSGATAQLEAHQRHADHSREWREVTYTDRVKAAQRGGEYNARQARGKQAVNAVQQRLGGGVQAPVDGPTEAAVRKSMQQGLSPADLKSMQAAHLRTQQGRAGR